MSAAQPLNPIAQLLAKAAAEVVDLLEQEGPEFARISIVAHYPRGDMYSRDEPEFPVIHRREFVWRAGELQLSRSVTEERIS